MNWRRKSRFNRLETDQKKSMNWQRNHMNDPSWTSWDLFFVAKDEICSLEILSYQLRTEFQHQQSSQEDSTSTACLFQTYLTSFRNRPYLLKHLRLSVNKHGSCTQPNLHSDMLILYIHKLPVCFIHHAPAKFTMNSGPKSTSGKMASGRLVDQVYKTSTADILGPPAAQPDP